MNATRRILQVIYCHMQAFWTVFGEMTTRKQQKQIGERDAGAERGRETETETERQRQTETDRQIERQRDRGRERQRDRGR